MLFCRYAILWSDTYRIWIDSTKTYIFINRVEDFIEKVCFSSLILIVILDVLIFETILVFHSPPWSDVQMNEKARVTKCMDFYEFNVLSLNGISTKSIAIHDCMHEFLRAREFDFSIEEVAFRAMKFWTSAFSLYSMHIIFYIRLKSLLFDRNFNYAKCTKFGLGVYLRIYMLCK